MSDKLKKQYSNSNNLNTRISLHAKCSTNKYGFGNWIYDQYRITENSSILELGCGNGDMWKNRLESLSSNVRLILSDFSEGMLADAKKNLNTDRVLFETINIQNIPYDDASFDIVIANMMLYHVPNIDQAIKEVRRVLKPGGTFYCATYGEHGINEFFNRELADFKFKLAMNTNFTLQNGENYLNKHFTNIAKHLYEDSFEITDTDDLLGYLCSLTNIADIELDDNKLIQIKSCFENLKRSGKIIIPKEYGMFISQ